MPTYVCYDAGIFDNHCSKEDLRFVVVEAPTEKLALKMLEKHIKNIDAWDVREAETTMNVEADRSSYRVKYRISYEGFYDIDAVGQADAQQYFNCLPQAELTTLNQNCKPATIEKLSIEELITCKLCGERAPLESAHFHESEWVGDECCWDERLRSTA